MKPHIDAVRASFDPGEMGKRVRFYSVIVRRRHVKLAVSAVTALIGASLVGAVQPVAAAAQLPPGKGGSGGIAPTPEQLARYDTAAKKTVEGDRFLEAGNLDAAATAYREAISTLDTARAAWFGLARVHMAAGRYGEADQAFRHIVSAITPADDKTPARVREYRVNGPRAVPALMNYAITMARLQRPEDAIALYHAGLRCLNQPDDRSAEPVALSLVFIAPGGGPVAGAARYSGRTLEAAAHVAMAIDASLSSAEKALHHVDAAVASAPDLAIAHLYRGLLLREIAPDKPEDFKAELRAAMNTSDPSGESSGAAEVRRVAAALLTDASPGVHGGGGAAMVGGASMRATVGSGTSASPRAVRAAALAALNRER